MLTENERKKILAGEWPQLEYDERDECPFEPGQVVRLSEHVTLTIQRVRRNKKAKWVAHYMLSDFRPLDPRLKTRRWNDELEAYEYEPEPVDAVFHDRVAQEAALESLILRERHRKQMELMGYERRLQDARIKGKRGTERILRLKIRKVEDVLRDVA